MSTPGGLEVKHHVLTHWKVVFDEQGVEYQHYIVSGWARRWEGSFTVRPPSSSQITHDSERNTVR